MIDVGSIATTTPDQYLVNALVMIPAQLAGVTNATRWLVARDDGASAE